LHTIGQQLDRIEEKIISPTSTKIEKPLILLPEKRKSLGLKPKSQKNIEKIEEMHSELKIGQASSSKTITPISHQFFDSDSISSHDSTDSDIKVLKKIFEKVKKKIFLEFCKIMISLNFAATKLKLVVF
jgi:hypothetical protein